MNQTAIQVQAVELRINARKLFDTISAHLLKQGHRSSYPSGEGFAAGCAYRGADGDKCAVGCIIKDEFYHIGLEDQLVYFDEVKEAVSKSIGAKEENIPFNLLVALQQIHDEVEPEDWKESLAAVERNQVHVSSRYIQYYTETHDGDNVPSIASDAIVGLDDKASTASHHARAQNECASRGFVGYALMKYVDGGTVQTSPLKLLQDWI